MPQIQILDQNTINQIAAGEVIERPASVVKELLENAIDAKSSAITVEIKEGGISLIRVTDNGCGIEKQDIPVAFLRHSTSKIRSVEDLFTITSLGFRGEALSSIAAVAQVELITKVPRALHGVRYEMEGGIEKSLEEIGAPDGTTFLVRNLFYNVPARRKFLKAAQTEAGYISDLVEHIALSHPEVSIRFINNNQNKLHTSGTNHLKDVIYNLYGRDITSHMIAIDQSMNGMSLKGYIGKPVISRGNRSFENYFINGRYIKSNLISKAIESAYQPFLMQHKYPVTVLHIQIDSDWLDVNVHPTKMELRFRNEEDIYQFILSVIQKALTHKEFIPEVTFDSTIPRLKKEMADKTRNLQEMNINGRENDLLPETRKNPEIAKEDVIYTEEQLKSADMLQSTVQQQKTEALKSSEQPQKIVPMPNENYYGIPMEEQVLFVRERSSYRTDPVVTLPELNQPQVSSNDNLTSKEATSIIIEKPEQLELFNDTLLSKASQSQHYIIGQLFDTYWLVQFQDKLFMIDQHAAHEKVLYEKTIESLKNRETTSQNLNPPMILTLSLKEETILKEYITYFADMGFEIEHFGGKEYSIRAVPDNLFGIASQDLFLEMLSGLSSEIKTEKKDLIYEKVAMMSCKAAVKGNHSLSYQEAHSLIEELLELKNPYHCPHGRPTIVAMSKQEIERKFKRIL